MYVQIKKTCDYRQSIMLASSNRFKKFSLYSLKLSIDEEGDFINEAVDEAIPCECNYVEKPARDKFFCVPTFGLHYYSSTS